MEDWGYPPWLRKTPRKCPMRRSQSGRARQSAAPIFRAKLSTKSHCPCGTTHSASLSQSLQDDRISLVLGWLWMKWKFGSTLQTGRKTSQHEDYCRYSDISISAWAYLKLLPQQIMKMKLFPPKHSREQVHWTKACCWGNSEPKSSTNDL